MHRYHWFWDLDGVLADFDAHLQQIWPARPAVSVNARTEQLTDDVRQIKQAAYDQIAARDGFYAELPWVPGMRDVWEIFRQHVQPEHSWVLSAVPSFRHRADAETLIARSIAEKHHWVTTELAPQIAHPRSLVVRGSHEKIRHVQPQTGVLIDDRPENITEWEAHGGIGILHRTPHETLAAMTALWGA